MKFLFLEPFYGGSHKSFAQGLVYHSNHKIDLFTLPARFWKWRMRGAALHFLKKIPPLKNYNGIIITDLMSLSDFKALCKEKCPPTLVYFHENQLTYPLAPGEHKDYQFGFTDITTALSAEMIVFNSRTHLDAFFSILPDFLNMMPEYRPEWVIEEIRNKTDVLYPGCSFSCKKNNSILQKTVPPLIIWNHRWEFDKNPTDFFSGIDAVLLKGLDFRLSILGENFQNVPKEFIAAKKRYKNRIVQYGYIPSRDEYLRMLGKGSIVVSTAKQENFGISVVEAIRLGCIPVLPYRLAYPEILPETFHKEFLYVNQSDFIEKLANIISGHTNFDHQRTALSRAMERFEWKKIIELYDEKLEILAGMS